MGLTRCGGMRTSWSGRPMDSACRLRRSRRTPCMAMRSWDSVTVVRRATTRKCFCWSSACSAMALSLPPLQQKRMGSSDVNKISKSYKPCREGAQHVALLRRKSLVPAAKAVVHAGAHVAAESGVAQSILIMLVEEISGAGVKRNAVANVVVGGDVEAGVAGIAGEAESEKIRVGANAGEIAAYCYAEAAIGGVQSERAGIDGTPGQVVSGKLRKIESVGGGEDAAVVIGVVSRQVQPAPKSGFPCEVDSSGASEVGVEKISEVRR